MTEQQKAIFYSSWMFSGIRLFCSLEKNGKTFEQICNRFTISRTKAMSMIKFLLEGNLLLEEKAHYLIGTQNTFVPQNSPFYLKHQSNWRIKAIQACENISQEEMIFTGPMSISETDFLMMREKLTTLLKEFSQIAKDSSPEVIACLNIDLFKA